MGGKKGGGEGSKKAAGQARKADAAAAKTAKEDAKKAALEDAEWQKGAKDGSKKEAEAAKKAELARKKAERDALLAEDEKNTPGRDAPKNTKQAVPRNQSSGRALDLSQLDFDDNKKLPETSARSITDAIAMFTLLAEDNGSVQVDRHLERRQNAVYKAFKEKRLTEMREEGLKLKLNQRLELINREWRRHHDNMNSPNYIGPRLAYNASKEEVKAFIQAEKDRLEARLAAK